MAIAPKAQILKDWLGVRIPQWWDSITQVFVEVSDLTPLPVVDGKGVPASFTEMTENGIKFNVQKGQLNKFDIKARVGNEHVESSREVQGIVNATTIVGQIFKASKDNISALSLTLESAADFLLDSFETYADSTALQAEWAETTNPATLETIIVKGGVKSMSLPLTTNGDEWMLTVAASDFTNHTGTFDFWFDELGAAVSIFIGDGINTKSTPLAVNNSNEWVHAEVNENALTEDQAGITDVANITKIGFRVDTKNIGSSLYIDNLRATPPPGSIEIKLWNMGPTLPVSGTTSIDSGVQYDKLNNSVSSVVLPLLGGKRLYHIHNNFTAGAHKNDPLNELLEPNNYYIIELKHIDTDVSVYGPSTSFAYNYYNNGYAFTAPDEATAITGIGEFSDIMFVIQSMQDIYVVEAGWSFNNSPNGNSDLFLFLEDTQMKISGVFVDHSQHPDQNDSKDSSLRPKFLEDGGKAEWYYNDDFTDGVTSVVATMSFLHEPSQPNG